MRQKLRLVKRPFRTRSKQCVSRGSGKIWILVPNWSTQHKWSVTRKIGPLDFNAYVMPEWHGSSMVAAEVYYHQYIHIKLSYFKGWWHRLGSVVYGHLFTFFLHLRRQLSFRNSYYYRFLCHHPLIIQLNPCITSAKGWVGTESKWAPLN